MENNIEKNIILGVVSKEINNDYYTYNEMVKNFYIIDKNPNRILCFDFSKTSFLQGNMVVFLDLLKKYHYQKNGESRLIDYPPRIKELLERNGYIEREIQCEDNRKTTITFSRHYFKYTNIDIFCNYIIKEMIEHYRMNFVTRGLKDKILESVLELFNNVTQHTTAEFLSTCGQFFPNTKKLIFSIGNLGETFYEKISSKINTIGHCECIDWALKFSNSTKFESGGLGLYTLNEFLKLNNGQIQIISGRAFYTKQFKYINDKGNEVVKKEILDYNFPGTIVTLIIDLKQNLVYNDKIFG